MSQALSVQPRHIQGQLHRCQGLPGASDRLTDEGFAEDDHGNHADADAHEVQEGADGLTLPGVVTPRPFLRL